MITKSTDKTLYMVPECACPTCGGKSNAGQKIAFELKEDQTEPEGPRPGAWALCGHCGEILVYDDSLETTFPSDSDIARITTEQWEYLEQLQNDIRIGMN